jgi:hypothetical protein
MTIKRKRKATPQPQESQLAKAAIMEVLDYQLRATGQALRVFLLPRNGEDTTVLPSPDKESALKLV